jgi:hypothetical protein
MSFQEYVDAYRVQMYERLTRAGRCSTSAAASIVDATVGNREWLADRRQEWRRLYGRKAA